MASDPLPLIVRPHASDDALPASRYDFERPRSFSARHLRAAETAHGVLSERLAVFLSNRLGETVEVTCMGLHEVQTVDFERSRTLPAALFRTRLDGGGFVGIDLAPPLALFLVERQLGSRDPLGASARALSPLEQRVIERHWLPVLGAAFSEAWQSLPPAPERFETHASRLPLAPPTAPVVVADLHIRIGGGEAILTFAYPQAALTSLLSVVCGDEPEPTVHALPSAPAERLAPLPLDLRAEFGRTRLSVGDLLRLAPGDVIPLARAEDAPVPVWIGDRLRFEARPGLSGSRLALQLLTPPAPPSPDDSPLS